MPENRADIELVWRIILESALRRRGIILLCQSEGKDWGFYYIKLPSPKPICKPYKDGMEAMRIVSDSEFGKEALAKIRAEFESAVSGLIGG